MQVFWDTTLCVGLFHPGDEGTRSSNLPNDRVTAHKILSLAH